MKTLLLGMVMLVVGTGCALVRDEIDETVSTAKNRTAATAAWKDTTEIFEGISDEEHFGEGFRAGYYNSSQFGGASSAELPLRYTARAYRSRRGQERVKAWIDGFAHGSMMAMDDLIARTESGYAKVGYASPATRSATADSNETATSAEPVFEKSNSVKMVPVSDTE